MKDTFEAILNASRDLVCLIEDSTRICYASPSHERLLGYDGDFLMDSSILEIVHNEDKLVFNDYLRSIFKKKKGKAVLNTG